MEKVDAPGARIEEAVLSERRAIFENRATGLKSLLGDVEYASLKAAKEALEEDLSEESDSVCLVLKILMQVKSGSPLESALKRNSTSARVVQQVLCLAPHNRFGVTLDPGISNLVISFREALGFFVQSELPELWLEIEVALASARAAEVAEAKERVRKTKVF